MKRLLACIICLLTLASLSAEISFPESLYVIHKESGYKILIGSSPYFIINKFGKPKHENVLFHFESPEYEIIEYVYDDFSIRLQTYRLVIMMIVIIENSFCTSQGIEVGNTEEDVIVAYGNPNDIMYHEGYRELVFSNRFDEINHEAEYTELVFSIKNGVVRRISIVISSTV